MRGQENCSHAYNSHPYGEAIIYKDLQRAWNKRRDVWFSEETTLQDDEPRVELSIFLWCEPCLLVLLHHISCVVEPYLLVLWPMGHGAFWSTQIFFKCFRWAWGFPVHFIICLYLPTGWTNCFLCFISWVTGHVLIDCWRPRAFSQAEKTFWYGHFG